MHCLKSKRMTVVWFLMLAVMPAIAAPPVAPAESKSRLESEPGGWRDILPAIDLKGWRRVPVPAGRVDNEPWAFWDLMPTFVEMSGAKPPQGYETDGLPLIDYLKGGKAPQREHFYWELHESGRPIQAARFGKWKAVRNGTDKPIEIYDLDVDVAESNDLSEARPELVDRAGKIFSKEHRPDPNWPLHLLSEALFQSRKEAWKTKNWRDKNQWAPENSKPLSR
jgi:arylsulfatase A